MFADDEVLVVNEDSEVTVHSESQLGLDAEEQTIDEQPAAGSGTGE